MSKPRLVFKVEGSEELVRRFNAIATKKAQETKDAIKETALNVQKKAKKRAPVDNGHLRASIKLKPHQSGFSIDVGSELPYAVYQEWGTGIFANHPSISGRKTPWVYKSPKTGEFVFTRGNKPQPFLHPAFESEKPEYIRRINKIFKSL